MHYFFCHILYFTNFWTLNTKHNLCLCIENFVMWDTSWTNVNHAWRIMLVFFIPSRLYKGGWTQGYADFHQHQICLPMFYYWAHIDLYRFHMFYNLLTHKIHLQCKPCYTLVRFLLVLCGWHDSLSKFAPFYERWLAQPSIRLVVLFARRKLTHKCLIIQSL